MFYAFSFFSSFFRSFHACIYVWYVYDIWRWWRRGDTRKISLYVASIRSLIQQYSKNSRIFYPQEFFCVVVAIFHVCMLYIFVYHGMDGWMLLEWICGGEIGWFFILQILQCRYYKRVHFCSVVEKVWHECTNVGLTLSMEMHTMKGFWKI